MKKYSKLSGYYKTCNEIYEYYKCFLEYVKVTKNDLCLSENIFMRISSDS